MFVVSVSLLSCTVFCYFCYIHTILRCDLIGVVWLATYFLRSADIRNDDRTDPKSDARTDPRTDARIDPRTDLRIPGPTRGPILLLVLQGLRPGHRSGPIPGLI